MLKPKALDQYGQYINSKFIFHVASDTSFSFFFRNSEKWGKCYSGRAAEECVGNETRKIYEHLYFSRKNILLAGNHLFYSVKGRKFGYPHENARFSGKMEEQSRGKETER